jgi:hypothetical protein
MTTPKFRAKVDAAVNAGYWITKASGRWSVGRTFTEAGSTSHVTIAKDIRNKSTATVIMVRAWEDGA